MTDVRRVEDANSTHSLTCMRRETASLGHDLSILTVCGVLFSFGFFFCTLFLKISIIYLNFEIRKCSCCVNTLQQVFACYYIYPIMGNYHSVMYFKITAILFLFFEIISLYVVFLSVFTSAYD